MRLPVLLPLLLLPAAALAQQPSYDLSCANVRSVTIVRHAADDFSETRAHGGHIHIVFFRLTPDAADGYQPILEQSRRLTPIPGRPGEFSRRRIAVTTGGHPLRNDVPEIESHSSNTVNTLLFREEDALALAREVCPSAPVEVLRPPAPAPPGAHGPNPAP